MSAEDPSDISPTRRVWRRHVERAEPPPEAHPGPTEDELKARITFEVSRLISDDLRVHFQEMIQHWERSISSRSNPAERLSEWLEIAENVSRFHDQDTRLRCDDYLVNPPIAAGGGNRGRRSGSVHRSVSTAIHYSELTPDLKTLIEQALITRNPEIFKLLSTGVEREKRDEGKFLRATVQAPLSYVALRKERQRMPTRDELVTHIISELGEQNTFDKALSARWSEVFAASMLVGY